MKLISATDAQDELLRNILSRYSNLSPEIVAAYRAVPRHRFVKKFSPDRVNWIELSEENFSQYADLIYADFPLLVFDDHRGRVCTISQPSFVLSMLRDLEIQPGQRIFELGAGSGWNAALMGYLVGEHGSVTSIEIIQEMAREARENVAALGLNQVHIRQGDAMTGNQAGGPYDRGIFTAGAPDLPGIFFSEIKDGGKLLFVLKDGSSNDLLLYLRKWSDHFEITDALPCYFVPVTGESEVVPKTRLIPRLQEIRRGKIYQRTGAAPRVDVVASELNWWVLG